MTEAHETEAAPDSEWIGEAAAVQASSAFDKLAAPAPHPARPPSPYAMPPPGRSLEDVTRDPPAPHAQGLARREPAPHRPGPGRRGSRAPLAPASTLGAL